MTQRMRTVALKVTAAACAVTAASTAALLGATSAQAQPAEGTVHGLGAAGAVKGSYNVHLDQETTSADKKEQAQEYGGKLSRS